MSDCGGESGIMDDNNKLIRLIYRRCLIPSMLAILGGAIGQIVTAMIVGRALGAEELSVIGLALPVYYVYATAGAMLGVGGTAVCARLIGQDRFEDSRRAFTAVYLLTMTIAIVLTAIMLLFSERVTSLLGVTPDMDIFPKVRDYIRILSIGGVFIMSIYPAFNLLRLDGRNKSVASVFFVMSSTNVFLSYVLVTQLNIGVTGAAIATVCGAGASGIFGAVLLFAGSKNFRLIHPEKGKAEGEQEVVGFRRLALDIVVYGSPSALENLCIMARTIALNWMLISALQNIAALSAFKVTDSVNGFAQIFIAGASGSMIPFIGVFSSERDTRSIRQLLALGFKWGLAMTVAFTAVCLIFAGQVSELFGMGGGDNQAVALPAIRLFAISFPLAAANNILVCLYQANGHTAAANILTLGRSLAWVLLAAFILTPGMGTSGLWHSFWIAELLALMCAAAVSAVYRNNNKYLSRLFLLNTNAEANGKYKSFSVKNSTESITGSAAAICGFCETNSLSPRQTMAISLAIEEMLVMICEHCFEKNSADTVNVRILIYENRTVLRIRNVGKAFNPVAYYEQENMKRQSDSDGIDAFADSLGIGMIIKLAETVDYRNTFGVNNLAITI